MIVGWREGDKRKANTSIQTHLHARTSASTPSPLTRSHTTTPTGASPTEFSDLCNVTPTPAEAKRPPAPSRERVSPKKDEMLGPASSGCPPGCLLSCELLFLASAWRHMRLSVCFFCFRAEFVAVVDARALMFVGGKWG